MSGKGRVAEPLRGTSEPTLRWEVPLTPLG